MIMICLEQVGRRIRKGGLGWLCIVRVTWGNSGLGRLEEGGIERRGKRKTKEKWVCSCRVK